MCCGAEPRHRKRCGTGYSGVGNLPARAFSRILFPEHCVSRLRTATCIDRGRRLDLALTQGVAVRFRYCHIQRSDGHRLCRHGRVRVRVELAVGSEMGDSVSGAYVDPSITVALRRGLRYKQLLHLVSNLIRTGASVAAV